jgi:hypothetical protein
MTAPCEKLVGMAQTTDLGPSVWRHKPIECER